MNDYYILDINGNPVVKPNFTKWMIWFETANRSIGDEVICGCRVSTVFLGIDHSFGGPVPLLWETLVFGGPLNEEMDRCSGSREQAEAMHAKMVERVRREVM